MGASRYSCVPPFQIAAMMGAIRQKPKGKVRRNKLCIGHFLIMASRLASHCLLTLVIQFNACSDGDELIKRFFFHGLLQVIFLVSALLRFRNAHAMAINGFDESFPNK